jgi:hypothetical protein
MRVATYPTTITFRPCLSSFKIFDSHSGAVRSMQSWSDSVKGIWEAERSKYLRSLPGQYVSDGLRGGGRAYKDPRLTSESES